MIDMSDAPAALRLALLGIPFLVLIIGGVLNIYVATPRNFSVMCHAFRRSSGLYEEIALWGTLGLKSRMIIVSAMSLGLIWPSLGLRRGWLNAEDSNEFPVYLKRIMKVSSYCLVVGLIVMVALTSFVKFVKS
ncbi:MULTISPECIES: hypothetical protein [unclassified Pseudomonas]|uniref:hypothetical protein n=1 Tax=unclassified Pseudomonas TaxID=196821 RepID=UPI0035C14D29